MDRKIFCKKLKRARVEAGFKQSDVAKLLDIPVSAVSMMESGNRKIDVLELVLLAEYYSKSIEYFLRENSIYTRRRWYDMDPILSEAVDLLQQAPAKMQRSAAYGIIGFLKQIDAKKR